jgi:hypothetical protein
MAVTEMNEKISKNEFENALQIFLDTFIGKHPKNTWPDWFRLCTTYGGQKEERQRWRFSFTAIPSSVLNVGESWEMTKNNGYVLVQTDPQTKERRYVISNVPSQVVTIFEAVIDLSSRGVSIIVDKDLGSIDGKELLPLRGNGGAADREQEFVLSKDSG